MKRLFTYLFQGIQNKRVLICVFFLPLLLSIDCAQAQLDTIPWLSPLHSRKLSTITKHYIYLSTPESNAFTVTIKDGAGNVLKLE